MFLNSDKSLINGEIFNVGYQNLSIMQIAKKVKKIIENKLKNEIKITKTESDDKRSYHINWIK